VECEGLPHEPLTSPERSAMTKECGSQLATCAVHALSTLNVEADRRFGLQLADQGCKAGQRSACMVGGLLADASASDGAASEFYAKACLIAEDEHCRAGMREGSRHADHSAPVQTMQVAVEEEAPKLCKTLRFSQFEGTSHFEVGRFVGIRVTQVQSSEFGPVPFEPGDLLLDTIRCGKDDCSGIRFYQRLARLCDTMPDRLLHDLTLSVRSDVPGRTRTYKLRRAVTQASGKPPF
jgi:hypothetical protein